jgi:hypothetical protein
MSDSSGIEKGCRVKSDILSGITGRPEVGCPNH